MGNSDSRCCDVADNKKEEKVVSHGNRNSEICNSEIEASFSDSACIKTDKPNHSQEEANLSHGTSNSSSKLATEAIMHTPTRNNMHTNSQENKNADAYDPRSPSDGITRTPICIPDDATIQSISDPRSPTSGVKRTPIVALDEPAAAPESNLVIRNFHDPRSPTSALSRTPLNFLNTDNLRRTVLLSNLMSSPVSNKSEDTPLRSDTDELALTDDEMNAQRLKEISVFNLSDVSDWNRSLASSTAAIAGSDPQCSFSDNLSQNFSMSEHMGEKKDENSFECVEEGIADDMKIDVDVRTSSFEKSEMEISLAKIYSPGGYSALSSNAELEDADQHASHEIGTKACVGSSYIESKSLPELECSAKKGSINSLVDEPEVIKESLRNECKIIKKLAVENEKNDENMVVMVTKPKSLIPFGVQSSAMLRKRSFSSGHPVQPKKGVEKFHLTSFPLSPQLNVASEQRSDSAARKENEPQKKIKKNIVMEATTRSPLAVLGHSNSPQPRRVNISKADDPTAEVRKAALKTSSSRLPRYKGSLAGRPRASSLSGTRIPLRESKKPLARLRGKENL